MNYQQTLEFLFNQLPMYQRVGKAAYKADLSTTYALMDYIGNPEKDITAVHIAGTNGKGSVSHIIASVLQQAGYKTGLYTSPHLRDFRERIRVNGEEVSEDFVVEFVEKYQDGFKEIQPSFFEMTVAMAFEYFIDQKTDINVVEVGMGGRLDSTNILQPEISVITNIGLDHTQFLGDTIEKVAGEKAGIIKKDVPLTVGETQKETAPVFDRFAEEKGTSIVYADQDLKAEGITYIDNLDQPLVQFDIYMGKALLFKAIQCPLSGSYQVKNILTAVRALLTLAEKYTITKDHIQKGILNVIDNTHLMGRWQVLQNNPLVICDTGHNTAGIKEILKRLDMMKYQQLHFVLGMVNDKNIAEVIGMLPKEATYYFCKADIPRGLDADELAQVARSLGRKGEVYGSVQNALSAAKEACSDEDMVFVGGSTFTVAEVV